jgi:hypothetical protein
VVGHFSAKSAKHPLLIEMLCAFNLFNPRQILTLGGEYTSAGEILFHKKICKFNNITKVYHSVVVNH